MAVEHNGFSNIHLRIDTRQDHVELSLVAEVIEELHRLTDANRYVTDLYLRGPRAFVHLRMVDLLSNVGKALKCEVVEMIVAETHRTHHR